MRRVKIISWFAGFIVLLAVLACSNNIACAWGGSGTETAPYLITNAADLISLKNNITSSGYSGQYFKQMADVAFTSGQTAYPIGSSYMKFNGRYDGNGFIISGININTTSSYQGLFGYVGTGGMVKNVHLDSCVINGTNYIGGIAGWNEGLIQNCSVTASQITGQLYVGGIAGSSITPGVIESSSNSGTISSIQYAGGITGKNASGMVQQCRNAGTVNASSDTAGGICGYNYYGTVQNCYNTESVHGETGNAGGVVGWQQSGTVKNCCSYGAVSGSTRVGGVIGVYDQGTIGSVANNYFLQSGTINSGFFGIGSPLSSNEAEAMNAANMQTDEFAYNLNTTGEIKPNSNIWSRNPDLNTGFPHIADKNNHSICKVVFKNGGSKLTEVYSSFTGMVSLPVKPAQAGYIFGGWYTENNGKGAAFTANSALAQDLTVYAYWFADPGNMPAFEMLGGEKRSESPQGLRFKTRIYKNTLFINKKIMEYGTVILPLNLIPSGQTLAMETVPTNYNADKLPNSKIVIIKAANIFTDNDDYLVFTGVLTNIPSYSLTADITARAYVKYIDSDNTEKIIYSQPVTISYNSASAAQ